MGSGELQNGRAGGKSSVIPTKRRGRGGDVVLMTGAGDAQNVSTQALEVLAIVKGGATSFHPLKGRGGGQNKFYHVLRWVWNKDFPIF